MEANLGSVITVLAFVIFVGIVVWAYSKRRKRAFDDAANAPFALPDEETLARDARQGKGDTNGTGASR
jgi:cytochrome c oxidase cbb3-type subunit IV